MQRPLLRLCWNKQDPNYLATFAMDSNEVSLCLTYYATCSGEQNEVSLSSFATFNTVHCLLLYCLVKKFGIEQIHNSSSRLNKNSLLDIFTVTCLQSYVYRYFVPDRCIYQHTSLCILLYGIWGWRFSKMLNVLIFDASLYAYTYVHDNCWPYCGTVAFYCNISVSAYTYHM